MFSSPCSFRLLKGKRKEIKINTRPSCYFSVFMGCVRLFHFDQLCPVTLHAEASNPICKTARFTSFFPAFPSSSAGFHRQACRCHLFLLRGHQNSSSPLHRNLCVCEMPCVAACGGWRRSLEESSPSPSFPLSILHSAV